MRRFGKRFQEMKMASKSEPKAKQRGKGKPVSEITK